MSTHNTHYPTSKKFASAFPVPASWCLSEDLKTITVFRCHDDANTIFDVTVCFLDGVYFFYFTFGLKPDNCIYFITSCSFVSLKNCLLGFRSTARSLRWVVEDNKFRNKIKEV